MSTGLKLKNIALAVLLSSGLLYAAAPAIATTPAQAQTPSRKPHKKKEAEPPPPLPSGPTGRPVPPMPLDAIAAVPPQVTFENNQLTIIAPNSTLSDILRAVRKQTGAEIDVPSAPERVVTHLGPGPARDVLADLLNGSRFNYVLLGSPSDEAALTRVVLVPKSGSSQQITENPVVQNVPNPGQPAEMVAPPPAAEANEADGVDDNSTNADENNNDQQAGEVEQAPVPDQNGVKTPQQMLQEMQQRQMQLQQQQQQPGQQPAPQGSGTPPHPPQEK